MRKTCLIIGAGLAGSAAAWELTQHGFKVRVHEQADVVGGHVRNEWLRGIPYEPHGAHIFHTADEDVWNLVTKLAAFVPYRHRVAMRIRSHHLSWPLQHAELSQLEEWPEIEFQLSARPPVPDSTNFETHCVSLMGETLYGLAIREYTRKQWGRDPDTLSASAAYGRIELRGDGHHDVFRDPYQGWPDRGYTELVEGLLERAELHLGQAVTHTDLVELCAPGEPVIVTSALDDFFGCGLGPLEWRGVRLKSELVPHAKLVQPAMVVNDPDATVPWTRSIETKWALERLHSLPGTIVMREYPGAPSKHYPVPDSAGANRALQRSYEHLLVQDARNLLIPAGRLATYRYINMDQAIRQGLDAARRILEAS
ncbi:FAD-binding protein [Kitasatospora acidiphila]|uniref:FAD-binding protein n=1 Tax=Kitasatospora acidiphila TaxID=2567942 RepID=A0A540VYX5_9ACTN|nr:UDP-galactopyranose mutase [Kitasatospora acidiphila]TQF01969.1 FAD-binding protein [Kitasatospora acidiphila]